MNTFKMKLAFMGICGLMLVPGISQADTSAVQLSEKSALFTIDFTFEESDFATAVPLTTKAGATYADRIDSVGYTIQKKISAESNPVVSTTGIVLAPNLQIIDGKYQIPTGTKHTFTLLVVATFTDTLTDDYQAKITKLPYWFDTRRTTIHQNQLDEIAPAILEVE